MSDDAAERRRREPPRARRRRGDPEVESGEAPETRTMLGTVAVVGYPNVGKSTLVNRLAGRRETVVHERPGVTRDRKEVEAEWNGKRFRLVDTGGIDLEGPGIARDVADQARQAVAEADLVLFVLDTRIGIGPGDEEVAAILRRAKVPTIVVANKAESPAVEQAAVEFHALGLGDPVPVSGIHGTGSGDLLDLIVERLEGLPTAEREEVVGDEIRVAILGRPNVGKSSLLNALVGAPRVLVSEVPGTTRDAIDMRLERDGTAYRLIDTAGLRRRRKHRQEVEYWSELRAIDAAREADVALVLIDGSEGVTDQDLAVADEARKAGCATLVVVSKWDINTVDLDDLRDRIDRKLRQRPPLVTTSAVTRRGLDRLLERIRDLYGRYTSRMPTPAVNRVLQDAMARRQPPLVGGRRLKLIYGAQVQTRPPRFRITVNDRKLVSRDWVYYLENRLREAAELEGCPVIIDLVER
jgi:GTPase